MPKKRTEKNKDLYKQLKESPIFKMICNHNDKMFKLLQAMLEENDKVLQEKLNKKELKEVLKAQNFLMAACLLEVIGSAKGDLKDEK